MPTRKLASWIDAFLEYTAERNSPPLFKKWAAISTIAGALERKVWLRVQGMNLYSNIYVLLVGPPATGKTVMTSEIEKLWMALDDHFIASSDIKAASLIDELAAAERRPIINGHIYPKFNSLLIASNELGSLIPAYDPSMMNALTDIYDCKRYSQRRRTSKIEIDMDSPQINMIAGTTPSYLNDLMPEGAWDQGFISRVIIVYSGDEIIRPLLLDIELDEDDRAWTALSDDLKIIAALFGKMSFTTEATTAIKHWHIKGGPPKPDHPRLLHYCGRRTQQLLKLCMVASVQRSDSLEVSIEDYQLALGWLLEAETFMPDIFKSMRRGGDQSVIEDVWHFAYMLYMKTKQPVPENRLVEFVSQKAPAHSVERIITVMCKAGLLEKRLNDYVPKVRKDI